MALIFRNLRAYTVCSPSPADGGANCLYGEGAAPCLAPFNGRVLVCRGPLSATALSSPREPTAHYRWRNRHPALLTPSLTGQVHRQTTPVISLLPKSSVGGDIGADQGDCGNAFVTVVQMGQAPSQQGIEAVRCAGMTVIPQGVSVAAQYR